MFSYGGITTQGGSPIHFREYSGTYRRQLENQGIYRKALLTAFQEDYPLSSFVQRQLSKLAEALGLGDAEVKEIAQQPKVRHAQDQCTKANKTRLFWI